MNIINSNKMKNAEDIINSLSEKKVKLIKKEDGLLEKEKKEDKIILSEDNRQILLG